MFDSSLVAETLFSIDLRTREQLFSVVLYTQNNSFLLFMCTPDKVSIRFQQHRADRNKVFVRFANMHNIMFHLF